MNQTSVVDATFWLGLTIDAGCCFGNFAGQSMTQRQFYLAVHEAGVVTLLLI